jgi:hypothetical protein
MKHEFIFDTRGDWMMTRIGGYLWDTRGNWVAWLEEQNVYSLDGEYLGTLSHDHRLLRKRSGNRPPLRTDIPPKPPKPDLPARAPLPPMFAELRYDTIDVLEEDPDVLKRVSELRPDMD